jgi:hypothetical protein
LFFAQPVIKLAVKRESAMREIKIFFIFVPFGYFICRKNTAVIEFIIYQLCEGCVKI